MNAKFQRRAAWFCPASFMFLFHICSVVSEIQDYDFIFSSCEYVHSGPFEVCEVSTSYDFTKAVNEL